jgi:glycosyltransferase involved in cell wall biosynthesis
MIDNVAVVIPVFNPEPGLQELCISLVELFRLVIVVDDGSCENQGAFGLLPENVVILKHGKNHGKGRAIKTALDYLQNKTPEVAFAVFADGDGQHLPVDIVAVSAKALETGNTTLGIRDFSNRDIPFRSRMGNRCTAFLVRMVLGYSLPDTQTGLRAIPRRLFQALISTDGERYEYEMCLFALLKERGERFETLPIQTVYIDSNRASHFKPFIDSFKVVRSLLGDTFLRFCGSSLLGFVVDNLVFTTLIFTINIISITRNEAIFIALIIARIVSATVNYFCNRFFVFRSHVKMTMSLGKYWLLVILIAAGSYVGTSFLSDCFNAFGGGITCLKILVEALLFLVSYKFQRKWVFSD